MRRHNKNGRCYIPLLDSNDPYFVKRREEIDRELSENETDFDETMDKILKYSPYIAQTGPAVRGDELIMQKHRDILENHKDVLEIYNVLSESITKTHSEEK